MSREQTNEAADFTELGALWVRPREIISDKFRLEEVVGSGGMGVVFKAWHLELEEHVALKFLLPSRAGDPELRSSGATSLCMWEAIAHATSVTTRFDFEGSMIESIERFFRGFGAEQTPYFHITKTPSRLFRARQALADLRVP